MLFKKKWLTFFIFFFCFKINVLAKKNIFPLPQESERIACLRSSKANLHVGPGLQYPVDWILVLKHMPVIIISEFGQWRRIKLCDGTVGWIHKSLLCSKKTALLRRQAFMFSTPSEHSKKIAKIGRDSVVETIKQKENWIKVLVTTEDGDKLVGWILELELWGLR